MANLVDARHGGWYGVLDRDSRRRDDEDYGCGDAKSWLCDYHSMGAVFECLRSL